jgi:uncharacterized surface protein with fasciclin (FAS1) repeats
VFVTFKLGLVFMSNYFQKSIAATLSFAVVSTSLLFGISSHAQSGMPTTTPSSSPTTPVKKPTGGTMTPGTGTTTPTTTAPAGKTIVDVASKSKSFTILVKALKAADLVDTLSGPGPYTVFAPTDAAFKKLGSAKLKSLLKPENQAQLKKILTYHVVAGEVTSKTLKAGTVTTVEGSDITVKIKGKTVTINNAKVLKADVRTSNGIVHAIDTVILPPN